MINPILFLKNDHYCDVVIIMIIDQSNYHDFDIDDDQEGGEERDE